MRKVLIIKFRSLEALPGMELHICNCSHLEGGAKGSYVWDNSEQKVDRLYLKNKIQTTGIDLWCSGRALV